MEPAFLDDQTLIPPQGWVVAEVAEPMNEKDSNEQVVRQNLAIAGDETIKLIDRIQNELKVHIPIAYLRVEEGKVFHILLLTSQDDFLSPEINAAKMLAEECSKNETGFDIRFSFTILEENTHEHVIIEQGYTLKHMANEDEPVMMEPKGVS